jgi:hypothetical protein
VQTNRMRHYSHDRKLWQAPGTICLETDDCLAGHGLGQSVSLGSIQLRCAIHYDSGRGSTVVGYARGFQSQIFQHLGTQITNHRI